jgi:hypothetical protein
MVEYIGDGPVQGFAAVKGDQDGPLGVQPTFGTLISSDPSADWTGGRRTGTFRPPSTTDPASFPCRTAVRTSCARHDRV